MIKREREREGPHVLCIKFVMCVVCVAFARARTYFHACVRTHYARVYVGLSRVHVYGCAKVRTHYTMPECRRACLMCMCVCQRKRHKSIHQSGIQ